MVIKVFEADKSLLVTIPYSQERVVKMKQIFNRRWDSENKYWIVPNNLETRKLLSQVFSDEQIVYSDNKTGLEIDTFRETYIVFRTLRRKSHHF